MTQFFRSGYYEYDKRKARKVKNCESAGRKLVLAGGSDFVLHATM